MSQQNGSMLVTQSKKESHVVAVRLTSPERANLAAHAAVEGKSVSGYIRDVLDDARARPRPTLAAAGALLGICDALLAAAAKIELDQSTRDLIAEQARIVLGIIQLHEREYRA
ncbi:plasmid mobilization protein [Qipengyuania sp.]|uniref:plasmid mobilization protein n=1 Tax=Qipengyuania sp. TaxID=2004515 RepID=UPI003736EADF